MWRSLIEKILPLRNVLFAFAQGQMHLIASSR